MEIKKLHLTCKEYGVYYFTLEELGAPGGGLCPKCPKYVNNKTSEFIKRSKEEYGDKFDYLKTEYTLALNKLSIKCKKHNFTFECRPGDHFKYSTGGCRKCRDEKSKVEQMWTTEYFIELAKKKFGDKFDYSRVEYKGKKTEVEIGCSIHGFRWQTPTNHLKSETGCEKCGRKLANMNYKGGGFQTQTTELFIIKAKERWGDLYDYSLTEYSGHYELLTIICPEHGEVEITARVHLKNIFGCSECFKVKAMPYSKQSVSWINIISKYKNIELQSATNGGEYRIYLKDYCLDQEYSYSSYISVDAIHHDSLTLFEYNGCLWHGCNLCFSKDDINPFNKKKMSELYEKTKKREGILRKLGYSQLIVIWEHEFQQLIKYGEDPEENPDLKKYLDDLLD
jgi:hypothetical protein